MLHKIEALQRGLETDFLDEIGALSCGALPDAPTRTTLSYGEKGRPRILVLRCDFPAYRGLGAADNGSVLKQLRNDLDIAVAAAFGWPPGLSEKEVLTRLVALNAERAREEAGGRIRWLRPDFQNPQGAVAEQTPLAVAEAGKAAPAPKPTKAATRQSWPGTLPEQMRVLRATLENEPTPLTAAELTARFTRARESIIAELLETLVILGRARALPDGRFGV